MKRAFVIFLVLFGCVLGEISQAKADLLITPVRAVFEGRDRSKVITLINTSDQPKTYRLGWTLLRLTDKGTYEEVPDMIDASGINRSAADMVRFSPRQVSLEARGRQRVRLSLRRPAELAVGEYRAHLSIVSLAKDGPAPQGNGQGTNAFLKVNLGFSIPVIVREGEGSPNVEIQNPQFVIDRVQGKDIPKLAFSVLNMNSTFSSYGIVTAYWTPQQGATEKVGFLGNISIYPEMDKREFRMTLDRTGFSNGILTLVYEGAEEYEGVVLDKKSFNIP